VVVEEDEMATSGTKVRRVAAIGLVGATLVLSSCATRTADTANSTAGPAAEANKQFDPKALGAPAAGGEGVGGGAQVADVSFKVNALDQTPAVQVGSFISTATMTVKVESVADAKPKLVATARALGGGLFGEETSFGEKAQSVITLKIAPEKFNDLIAEVAKLGTLAAQQVKTDDVTEQVIDLDARIKASESSLERTRTLLDRAQSLIEISQLEGEVARRQADLESLRGQKASLDNRINLSTIVVTLVGEHEATPGAAAAKDASQKPPELPGFMDGLSGGLKVAGNVGTVALAGLGALLPFSPVFVLIAIAVRLARHRRRGLSAAPTPASSNL